MIAISSPSPISMCRRRVSQASSISTVSEFRTMVMDADKVLERLMEELSPTAGGI
ncbi:MAG UNVERIFIED_CONTAM: hypothetical protein LVR29_32410 [Microcystis novacekii LVE1205-3]